MKMIALKRRFEAGTLRRSARYGRSRYLQIFAADTSDISVREQPTPILIVCGQFDTAQSWNRIIQSLSAKGYSGAVLDWKDIASDSVNNAVDKIYHDGIAATGFVPPIMISQSVSSFLAQKFLESYAIRALVMVNPLPPTFSPVNWPNILKDAKGKYDDINFRKLMDSIISDGVVRLETGILPVALVSTHFDNLLFGSDGRQENIRQLHQLFETMDSHHLHLKDEKSYQLSSYSEESQALLLSLLTDFLDDL